jgi:hypothetical protein
MIKKMIVIAMVATLVSAMGSSLSAEEKIIIPEKNEKELGSWITNAETSLDDQKRMVVKFTSSEWCGVGLNWAGWWNKSPKIVDSSQYKSFVFQFIVAEGSTGENTITLSLEDIEKGKSKSVNVRTVLAKNIPKEEVVEVKVPVSSFTEGGKLKSTNLWSIIIGAYGVEEGSSLTVKVVKAYFTNE